MKRITIAIDGHSSCGKSTMARQLAREAGYIYIDTGAMYRAATLFALRRGLFRPDGSIDEAQLQAQLPEAEIAFRTDATTQQSQTLLNGENVEAEIRGMEVSSHVSPVAALPCVRAALTAQQQAMGAKKGIVMDGRDIGTVVFPDAELKVFVTASDVVRARRRFDELIAKGQAADFDEVLDNVRRRDYIDSHRAVAPLHPAADALVLDNSLLTREEQMQWLRERFAERTAGE